MARAQTARSFTVNETATHVDFDNQGFKLSIITEALAQPLMADVTAELLDTTNAVRARGSAKCSLSASTNLCEVNLGPATLDFKHPEKDEDEIPLFRVRYTVASPGWQPRSGVLALDRITSELFELHVGALKQIKAGATYTARIRAVQPFTRRPRAGVRLEASATASYVEKDKQDEVISQQVVTTGANGFATFTFTAPSVLDLSAVGLNVEGRVANLHTGTTQTLEVRNATRFDLTTDKPLYQPGQIVHTRMLVLDAQGHAAVKKNVQVDVTDPDGTLVSRSNAVTSDFGIATTDWPVPARMRLGSYGLRATFPDPDDDDRSALATVRLSRYDLPTFAVATRPDHPFYLPGMGAIVEVRADYLFGKPVSRAHVRVVAEGDRSWNFARQRWDTQESGGVAGTLDASGVFRARLTLKQGPRSLAGNDYEDRHYAAYVTDASTGRTEQRRFDLRVSAHALHIYTRTERQAIGLPEQILLAVTTADGSPAPVAVRLSLTSSEGLGNVGSGRRARAVQLQTLRSDAHGLASLQLPTYEEMRKLAAPLARAGYSTGVNLHIVAIGDKGQSGESDQQLSVPAETFRITTDQALYRPGEPIAVEVASSLTDLPFTLQVVRHTLRGDVLLSTFDLALVGARAHLAIPTDERFSGVVFLQVASLGSLRGKEADGDYYGTSDRQTSLGSQAILFPRDNALHVSVKMSAENYQPGEQATANLEVHGSQDPDGDEVYPAPSALGLVAVDQAVAERNRTDSDFGGSGSSSFFFLQRGDYLDDAAGGFSFGQLQQLNAAKPWPEGAQQAARLLLSNLMVGYDTTNNDAPGDLAQAFRLVIDGQLMAARTTLAHLLDDRAALPTDQSALDVLLAPEGISLADLRDPWGMPFTLKSAASNSGVLNLELRSAGPDKVTGTSDDFSVPLANWHWFRGHQQELQHAADAFHQQTGLYLRSLAALRAEMQHEGIDFAGWRDPWGGAFTYRFSIDQTNFTISAYTNGDPAIAPTSEYDRGPFLAGTTRTSYTDELKRRVDAALSRYAVDHPFPMTQDEYRAALRASGLSAANLLDPWHHSLHVSFRTHSFFTDSVHTEAHATPGLPPQIRTVVTPVTAISDNVVLHSIGPDGRDGTADDFPVITLTHVRSTQSAAERVARRSSLHSVYTGLTGEITGSLTDMTGAAIPGALVIATNLKTVIEYDGKSSSDGRYLIGPLPFGTYKVRIAMPGFTDFVYDQVRIIAQNAVVLDATLNVGGVSEAVEVSAAPAMLETQSASLAISNISSLARLSPGIAAPGPTGTPRLRDYFPETLVWRPEIITAPDGSAKLQFPVADSITNWQLAASASTTHGNTGFGLAQFRTFQDFFASFDPPSNLTVGDTVALPVVLRNYSDRRIDLRSSIAPAAWFTMQEPASQRTSVLSQQSASPVFRFKAISPVQAAQQEFTAAGDGIGDRVAREVSVHPNGSEDAVTTAAILSAGENNLSITLPADMISSGTDTNLRIYPNFGSRLRDALVAMAAYPSGCAEQIISTAWPSLLLQRYAATLPTQKEQAQQRTKQNLQEAYENLLANQLPSGGFAYWSSDTRADLALTAYAVQFLTQARPYIASDESVVSKAIAYLAKEQQTSQQPRPGLWIRVDRDGKAHPEDVHANSMLTASISAMLAGAHGSELLIRKSLPALKPFLAEFDEPYTLASYASSAAAIKEDSEPILKRLRELALSENGGAYWAVETNTPFFGWGRAGRVETTAQVVRAFLDTGTPIDDPLLSRALLFLDGQQDRQSLWYSTQATARVLDVLAAVALKTPVGQPGPKGGRLSISLDGRPLNELALPDASADTGPVFVPLGTDLTAGTHQLALTMPTGAQSASVHVVTDFYLPWASQKASSIVVNNEQLKLAVSFSTLSPTIGKLVKVTAHVERVGFRGYGMLIAEVGIPPGADVDRASLEAATSASGYQLNHYDVLPDKVLLYLWPEAGGLTLNFNFSLRYDMDALATPSSVYDYYNPDVHLRLAPQRFSVMSRP